MADGLRPFIEYSYMTEMRSLVYHAIHNTKMNIHGNNTNPNKGTSGWIPL